MARKRVIDQSAILDAAEKVVALHGASNLTLDAVAEIAGVSKASVLYDYKNKRELIHTVVNRALTNDNDMNDNAIARFAEQDSPVIRGRIAAASTPFPEEFRSVALSLCAALAQDTEMRRPIQTSQTNTINNIAETSASPRGALLAYLALEGLKLLETLDYHTWPAQERAQIIREISWLVDCVPGEKDPQPAV